MQIAKCLYVNSLQKLCERVEDEVRGDFIEGPIIFSTEQLKFALKTECRAAEIAFGKALNAKSSLMMDVSCIIFSKTADYLTENLELMT